MSNLKLLCMCAVFAAALLSSVAAGQDGAAVRSLRGLDAAAPDPAPQEWTQLGRKPGAQKGIPVTFPDQPPLIPHATDEFDEISLKNNECLNCHADEQSARRRKVPQVSRSHFAAPDGKILQAVAKSRYACTTCHVTQTDAPPLVGTDFVSVPSAAK